MAEGLGFVVGLEDSRELFLVGLSLGLKLCRDLYLFMVLGGELMARSRLSVPFVSDVSIGRLPWG